MLSAMVGAAGVPDTGSGSGSAAGPLDTLAPQIPLLQATAAVAGDGLANATATMSTAASNKASDKAEHAFIYIVVVLLFYSIGIIVAIVMYLKREKEDILEEKAYEDYMNFRNDPDKWARYFRVQRMIHHLKNMEELRDKDASSGERLQRQKSSERGKGGSKPTTPTSGKRSRGSSKHGAQSSDSDVATGGSSRRHAGESGRKKPSDSSALLMSEEFSNPQPGPSGVSAGRDAEARRPPTLILPRPASNSGSLRSLVASGSGLGTPSSDCRSPLSPPGGAPACASPSASLHTLNSSSSLCNATIPVLQSANSPHLPSGQNSGRQSPISQCSSHQSSTVVIQMTAV